MPTSSAAVANIRVVLSLDAPQKAQKAQPTGKSGASVDSTCVARDVRCGCSVHAALCWSKHPVQSGLFWFLDGSICGRATAVMHMLSVTL